jgi:4-hydroxybenzoate polyprenyltransferase
MTACAENSPNRDNQNRNRLRSWLELARLPNVITAAIEPMAGWLLSGGPRLAPPDESGWLPAWLLLPLAGMSFYAGGIILNDVCDATIDARERPERPIPSGRIDRRAALVVGAVLLCNGVLLAMMTGTGTSPMIALALVLAILLYDAVLKQSVVGPWMMGTCRGLSVILGASIAQDFGGPALWWFSGGIALYVAGITWLSRAEVNSSRATPVVWGLVLQNVGMLILIGCALQARRFPAAHQDRPVIPLEGLLILALSALWVNAVVGAAWSNPSTQAVRRAVKTGVLSLAWLEAGVVASVLGVLWCVPMLILWAGARIAARKFMVT